MGEKRAEIDGLRTVAVLPVLLTHAGFPWAQGGFIGVDIFFVISGFLITQIILKEAGTGTFTIAGFYERRARRILPALFLIMIVSCPFAWWLMPPDYLVEFGQSLVAVSAFVSNILFWWQTDYFATTAELKPLLHTWSLAVEEQYYIFWPLLTVLLVKAGPRVFLSVTIFLTLCSLAAAQWSSIYYPSASFFLTHTRAWELLIGSLAAFAILHARPLSALARNLISSVAFLAVMASLALFNSETIHPGLWTLIPVIGTAAILLYGFRDTLPGKVLALPPFVWIGLISYSLYLWHQPVFAYTRLYLIESDPEDLILPMLACFPLAYLTWRFVENPFRDRKRIALPRIVQGAVFATVIPAVFGCILIGWSGFPYRYGPSIEKVTTVIKNEKQKRSDGTLRNGCEFARRGRDVEAWLKRWKCFPEGDVRILVVGDSHASDKAWALRNAGIKVGQIGSQGCPLVTAVADCLPVYDFAKKLVKDGKVDALVLANNLGTPKGAQTFVDGIQKEWGSLGVPILFFTQAPGFGEFELKWIRAVSQGFGRKNIRLNEKALASIMAFEDQFKMPGLTWINTRKLMCGDTVSSCNPFANGNPLVVDGGHLSSAGARRMAANILKDPVWNSWYASIKPRRL